MPSRSVRASVALLLAITVALAGTEMAGAALPDASPRATPSVEHTSVAAEVDTLDLRGDGVLPRRDGRTARVQKWTVRTLWYYETLPAKWDWSLSTAVAKWNASGGRIRLARTIYPRKAQVRIGYADIGSAAGMATVGATRGAFVHLSSRFSTMDALDARNRVTIMHVFAHELGHVLGFRHTATQCTLMAPVLDVDGCNVVPAAQRGYYKCRTLDTTLVQRFVRLYGGSARYPGATWCLIDPLPPALTGVTFSGGELADEPVAIHWTPPVSPPSGSRVVVKRWGAASCGTAPSGVDTFDRALSPGTWQDSSSAEAEDACFQVQLVNRYGAGRAPASRLLRRWSAPPAAPEIGEVTWHPAVGRFHAPMSHRAGTRLLFRNPVVDGGPCPGAFTDGETVTTDSARLGEGVGEFYALHPDGCVSFYAVDEETGEASAPTQVVVHAPLPTESPTVGPITMLEKNFYPWREAELGAGPGNKVGYAVFAGACPETPPSVEHWRTQLQGETGPNYDPDAYHANYGLFPSVAAGINCVLFTSLDWFGWLDSLAAQPTMTHRHGPVVMREFVDEGPEPPSVGTPVWDGELEKFRVPVSPTRLGSLHAIFDPADPTTCPVPGASGAEESHLMSGHFADEWDEWVFAPPSTPHSCVTFYIDAREGPVPLSHGVPVELDVP